MSPLRLWWRRLTSRFLNRNLTQLLVATQAFVAIAEVGVPGFADRLGLDGDAVLRGEWWRLVTWLCVPASMGLVGAFILLHFTFITGNRVEASWGSVKLAGYLGLGALCTAAVGLGLHVPVDTAFIPSSLLFAFAIEFPEDELMLFLLVSVPARWAALLDAAALTMRLMELEGSARLVPLASVANVLCFFWPRFIALVREEWSAWTSGARKRKFRERAAIPRRACSVCGLSDEDPHVELRICTCERCGTPTDFCVQHAAEHGAR